MVLVFSGLELRLEDPTATRSPKGSPNLSKAEGACELREALPFRAPMDVHTVQDELAHLQVTGEEAPRAGLHRDPIHHQERPTFPGCRQYQRVHHGSKKGIHADRSLQAGAWDPSGQRGDRAGPEGSPDGCGAQYQQNPKVIDSPQAERHPERGPSPRSVGLHARCQQPPPTFSLGSKRLEDGRGARFNAASRGRRVGCRSAR